MAPARTTTDVEKPAAGDETPILRDDVAGIVKKAVADPAAAQPLTWDILKSKPRRTADVPIYVGDQKYLAKVQALGQKPYDDLLATFPPTKDQREKGASYDEDRFAPALIAACLVEPVLTVGQVTQLFEDEDWSRGELGELYRRCLEVNHSGTSVPFSVTG